jgi:8-oxo-dGTP pyrophosphatase MutT (NUDIX family)
VTATRDRPGGRGAHRTPPGIGKLVAAYLRGELVAADPKDSATVLLLRDGRSGLEVFMLRRKAAMASAGGHFVFPGGLVDAADSAAEMPWAGPSPSDWARVLGCDAAQARGLVCAAIRETFEECGVLLAGPSPEQLVRDVDDGDWEDDRQAVASRRLAFGEVLRRRRLMLRTDLLAAWTRWITPEWARRRYNTRFFAVAIPAGQRPRDPGEESDHAGWFGVRDAVRRYQDRTLTLMLPTAQTLSEIAEHDTVASALAAPANLAPRRFQLVRESGHTYVTFGAAGAEQFAYQVPGLTD